MLSRYKQIAIAILVSLKDKVYPDSRLVNGAKRFSERLVSVANTSWT